MFCGWHGNQPRGFCHAVEASVGDKGTDACASRHNIYLSGRLARTSAAQHTNSGNAHSESRPAVLAQSLKHLVVPHADGHHLVA
jgi:hypothetical protein